MRHYPNGILVHPVEVVEIPLRADGAHPYTTPMRHYTHAGTGTRAKLSTRIAVRIGAALHVGRPADANVPDVEERRRLGFKIVSLSPLEHVLDWITIGQWGRWVIQDLLISARDDFESVARDFHGNGL